MATEYKTTPNTKSTLELISRTNSAKLHQHLTKFAFAVAVIVTALALSSAPVKAETQAKPFSFGGPGSGTNQTTVTLAVPARTSVRVSGVLNPIAGAVPVTIQIFKPGSSVAAASLPWAAGPTSVPFIFGLEAIAGGFTSQSGCPSSWQVKVRTTNGSVPPVTVSGSVTFDIQRPGTINLDMVGDAVSVSKKGQRTVSLAGHDTLGIANPTLIAGTGTFRIKAKWDTDPGDLLHFGQFYKVTVALLKPNGATADFEKRYSQHWNGDSDDKLDFRYTVTPADAALTGTWRLKITGSSTVRIVGFDIENPAFPSFGSTFQAQCN